MVNRKEENVRFSFTCARQWLEHTGPLHFHSLLTAWAGLFSGTISGTSLFFSNCAEPLFMMRHASLENILLVSHTLPCLTPSQTQRCQYCFYNAPCTWGLILFYSEREREREREREMKKTNFLNQNVSCFCLTQTAPCLLVQFTCPVAIRVVVPLRFVRAQSTVHWEDRLT